MAETSYKSTISPPTVPLLHDCAAARLDVWGSPPRQLAKTQLQTSNPGSSKRPKLQGSCRHKAMNIIGSCMKSCCISTQTFSIHNRVVNPKTPYTNPPIRNPLIEKTGSSSPGIRLRGATDGVVHLWFRALYGCKVLTAVLGYSFFRSGHFQSIPKRRSSGSCA